MPTATKTPLSSAAANIPGAPITMYKAYISERTGTCCVVPTQWDFSGPVPTKDMVAWCKPGDPQFDEFVQFCKDKGWL